MKLPLFLVLFLMVVGFALGQDPPPERINYFPYGEEGENVAALDPGNLLISQSVLLTNLYPSGNVSFSLSFDRKNWARYGMGPLYSSFFGMKNLAGCYCRIITDYGEDNKIVKEYFLTRGHCYSVFWNQEKGCWDVQENSCKRKTR